jgi:hypothetical protein
MAPWLVLMVATEVCCAVMPLLFHGNGHAPQSIRHWPIAVSEIVQKLGPI